MKLDKNRIWDAIDQKLEGKGSSTSETDEYVDQMFKFPQELPVDVDQAWANVDAKLEDGQQSSAKSFTWLKVAASVVLLVGCFLIYNIYFVTDSTILSSGEQARSFELIDGSQVNLNSHSKLVFNDSYNESARIVKLIGEGYFDVTDNNEKPFIVQTHNGQVQVVGTSFNIKTSSLNTEVFVQSGVVEVSNTDSNLVLEIGEKAIMAAEIRKVQPSNNELAWQSGILKFEHEKLLTIINSLASYHQKEINLDSRLDECVVTISFDNLNLEQSLSLLQKVISIKIEKKNQKILLTGNGC